MPGSSQRLNDVVDGISPWDIARITDESYRREISHVDPSGGTSGGSDGGHANIFLTVASDILLEHQQVCSLEDKKNCLSCKVIFHLYIH